jgi:hypothetical protein
MQGFSVGAGLASLAFWGFIAAIVVAGIWYDLRRKQSQQETLRRLVESGRDIQPELVDKVLAAGGDKASRLDRDFKLVALITLPTAVGLALFGLILGTQVADAKIPLLGVAVLVACIGVGFAIAARVARRWYGPDDESTPARL